MIEDIKYIYHYYDCKYKSMYYYSGSIIHIDIYSSSGRRGFYTDLCGSMINCVIILYTGRYPNGSNLHG